MNRQNCLAAAAAAVLPLLLVAGGPAFAHDGESTSDSPTGSPSESTGDPKGGLVGVDALTPISGGDRGSTAPEIRTGRYIDTAPELQTLRGYAFHRTMPGSTLTFGVTLLADGIGRSRRLVARLYAEKPGDTGNWSCGAASLDPDDMATTMPLNTVAGWSWKRPQCTNADVLYLVIENATQSPYEDKTQQVPTGTPYEIDIWEQPAITNVADLDSSLSTEWVYSDADDPKVQAEPGISMSEAVPLPDETAAVDLPLGRISWFYLPVQLGDHLQVLVETADGGSVAGAGLEARLLSPVGGMIDEVDPTTVMPAPRATNLTAGPSMVSAVTYEVDPDNRSDDAEHSRYSNNIALAGSAGNYLVAIYAQKLSGSTVTSLPVTIKVRTNPHETYDGDNYTLPTYAGDFPSYPAPSGPEPKAYDPEAADTSAPSSTGRSDEDWVLIGGLAGSAVLFGLVGALLVSRGSGTARPH